MGNAPGGFDQPNIPIPAVGAVFEPRLNDVQAPLHGFRGQQYRPRRQLYSRLQKERAVRLLDLGVPCRQVAVLMGPRCSSGTPIRWRQEARRRELARRRMEENRLNRRGGQERERGGAF